MELEQAVRRVSVTTPPHLRYAGLWQDSNASEPADQPSTVTVVLIRDAQPKLPPEAFWIGGVEASETFRGRPLFTQEDRDRIGIEAWRERFPPEPPWEE